MNKRLSPTKSINLCFPSYAWEEFSQKFQIKSDIMTNNNRLISEKVSDFFFYFTTSGSIG